MSDSASQTTPFATPRYRYMHYGAKVNQPHGNVAKYSTIAPENAANALQAISDLLRERNTLPEKTVRIIPVSIGNQIHSGTIVSRP